MNSINESPTSPVSVLEDPRVIPAVQEYLVALEAGRKPERREFLARFPEIAEALAGCLDAVEFVHSAGPRLHEQAQSGPAADPLLQVESQGKGLLGDFRILRELGRGAMGVVYEAEQISLGRRVALKVLPLAAALDAKQLQRFRNEAQAAAHLHHQHIVPVHFVGSDRGVHYYAMQYIDGRTLAQVIEDLRLQITPQAGPQPAPGTLHSALTPTLPVAALSTEPSTTSPAFFRSVALWGAQAAEALEHAHQLGVVHRDIKPANLLVDGRNHLWITDFGLARLTDNPNLTLSGDLVGTLRYMSPEQTQARPVLVDHRTDVYSLGAALYELLTLQPACSGRNRQELLQQIVMQEPRPLRSLNKAIPPELETIVLKALAKIPAERYATAQELADDLQRFLQDRPITARRPTLWQRLRSWARRHRAVVWSGVVSALGLVLVALLALAIAYVYVSAEKKEKEKALEEAKANAAIVVQQRQLAEANLELMRKAVDDINAGPLDAILASPQGQPARHALLQKSLDFYQEYTKQKSADPNIRLGKGWAYLRIGQIQAASGHRREAAETLTQAVVLFSELVTEFPATAFYQECLAGAHEQRGYFAYSQQPHQAQQDYRRAVALLSSAEFLDKPEIRNALARVYTRLGQILAPPDEAEGALRVAIDHGERLVTEFQESTRYRAQLAQSHFALGNVHQSAGHKEAAEAAYKEALRTAQGLSASSRVHFEALHALVRLNLARLLEGMGRTEEAKDTYREAVAFSERDVVHFPDIVSNWTTLSMCCEGLARLLEPAGGALEIAALQQKALDHFGQLIADMPDDDQFHEAASRCLRGFGPLLKDFGPLTEKERIYRRALALAGKLSDKFPKKVLYRSRLALWRSYLGEVLWATKQVPEAAAAFRQAAADYRAALALEANDVPTLNNLAWLLTTCPDSSCLDAKEAVRLAKKTVDLAKKTVDLRTHEKYLQNTLGLALYRARDWKEAIGALEKSRELYTGRPEGDRFDSFSTFFLAMAHWQLGEKQKSATYYDEAVRWMEKYKPKDLELLRFKAEAKGLLSH